MRDKGVDSGDMARLEDEVVLGGLQADDVLVGRDQAALHGRLHRLAQHRVAGARHRRRQHGHHPYAPPTHICTSTNLNIGKFVRNQCSL